MKWLVAGLGNPGETYRLTRHNIGFMVVEELAKRAGANWHRSAKFIAETAEAEETLFLKPVTFMNLSGQAIHKAATFYRIPLERVVVIHDDLDLQLGSVKVGMSKGPKQHNGLLSIEQQVGSKDFWRVRVGVDSRSAEERVAIPGHVYVLKHLSAADLPLVTEAVASAVRSFDTIARYARISNRH